MKLTATNFRPVHVIAIHFALILALVLVDKCFTPCWATVIVGLRNRGSILIIADVKYNKKYFREETKLNDTSKTIT